MDEQHIMVRSMEIRRAGGTVGLVFEIPWEEIDQMSRDHPVTAIAAFEEPKEIETMTAGIAQARHDALVHHEHEQQRQQQQNDPEEEAQDGQPE